MAANKDLDPDENFLNLVTDSSSCYLTENDLHDFFHFDDKLCFSVLHINCRSLNKNIEALQNLLSSVSGKLSVIALSEMYLTELSQDTFSLSG